MKLHVFEANVEKERLRAFCRDKAGRLLKRGMTLESGKRVYGREWKYWGILRAAAEEGEIVERILERVKTIGVAVSLMPPIPKKFFVFDVKLDVADIRIYSADRDLVAFRKRRRQVELGTDAARWGGGEEIHVGEVDIESADDAARMGIKNYRQLLGQDYCVEVIRATSGNENAERYLLREVRKVQHQWGIDISNLRIDIMRIAPGTDTDNARQSAESSRATDVPKLRDKLLRDLRALHSVTDKQKRGYALERLLNQLFLLEGLEPRRAFRAIGEQIDGSFEWHGQTHLLEAKWTERRAGGADFGAFAFKLDGKSADTRGLFISIGGFSEEGLAALRQKGGLRFICLDGAHLETVLQPSGSLHATLRSSWRHAGETGNAYLDPAEIKPQ
jgi:hypothetical protein